MEILFDRSFKSSKKVFPNFSLIFLVSRPRARIFSNQKRKESFLYFGLFAVNWQKFQAPSRFIVRSLFSPNCYLGLEETRHLWHRNYLSTKEENTRTLVFVAAFHCYKIKKGLKRKGKKLLTLFNLLYTNSKLQWCAYLF